MVRWARRRSKGRAGRGFEEAAERDLHVEGAVVGGVGVGEELAQAGLALVGDAVQPCGCASRRGGRTSARSSPLSLVAQGCQLTADGAGHRADEPEPGVINCADGVCQLEPVERSVEGAERDAAGEELGHRLLQFIAVRLVLLEDPENRHLEHGLRVSVRYNRGFRCRSGVVHLVFAFGMFSVFRSLAVVLHSYLPARWPPPVRKGEVVRGLVLASGKGSRLRTPRGRVKPLVSVAGVALLERAVRNLVDVGVDEVVVVVGYRAEEIERFCAGCRCGSVSRCDACATIGSTKATGCRCWLPRKHWGRAVLAGHGRPRARPVDPVVAGGFGVAVGWCGTCSRLLGWRRRGVDLDDVTRVRTEGRLVRDIGKGIASFDAFDTGAFLCTRRGVRCVA